VVESATRVVSGTARCALGERQANASRAFPTVANGEQTVIFVACRFVTLAESTTWSSATQFNGEIVVTRPHCVVLDVRVGQHGPLRRIKTPFGRDACRTQAA
jgi:hypothetical protein